MKVAFTNVTSVQSEVITNNNDVTIPAFSENIAKPVVVKTEQEEAATEEGENWPKSVQNEQQQHSNGFKMMD